MENTQLGIHELLVLMLSGWPVMPFFSNILPNSSGGKKLKVSLYTPLILPEVFCHIKLMKPACPDLLSKIL